MRKNQFILLFLLAALFTGCQEKKGLKVMMPSSDGSSVKYDEAVPDTLQTQLVAYADSNLSALVKVDAEYPVSEGPVFDSLRSHVSSDLELMLNFFGTGEEGQKNVKAYQGSLADGHRVVEHYGRAGMKYLLHESAEIDHYSTDMNDEQFTTFVHMNFQEKNDQYYTYTTSAEFYLGGAHGSYGIKGTTVDAVTGQRIREVVSPKKAKAMQRLLEDGVMEYFKDCDQPVKREELKDYLFLNNGPIPIPAQQPYLTKDGVCFVYQQYEIAAYAVGLITFTIPYAKIAPYLSPAARRVLKM